MADLSNFLVINNSQRIVTLSGSIHDIEATLTGTVATWIGYGEAEPEAREGGVPEVINRLEAR